MSDQVLGNSDGLVTTAVEEGTLHFFARRLHWQESRDEPGSIGATNYCPASEPILISTKPLGISEVAVLAEKRRILGLKRYFRECRQCWETMEVGRFNSTRYVCDGCAEASGDVVF